MRPPDSPDLNPVDYNHLRLAKKRSSHQKKIRNVSQMK